MRTSTFVLGILLAGSVACAAVPTPARSNNLSLQGLAAHETAVSDTSDTVDPYTTNRSLVYHVLASPAYVLHGLTRPLGWGVKYAEQKFPALFQADLPPRGALPLIDLGGPTGFSGGLLLYDNHLFGSDHGARVSGLYSGSDVFEISGHYQSPTPLGPGTGVTVRANFFSDPRDEFFRGGNDNDPQTDEFLYSRDQLDVTASVSYAPSDAAVAGQFDLLYEHVETAPRAEFSSPSLAGIGTVDLLTPRVALRLDFTRGRPRTYAGTEVVLQFNYTHDLTTHHFRHVRYVTELRQYLPVGFFPNSRRLALRARLEQVHPVFGGRDVPFYQLPSLGGQTSLRGYRYRRFQNEGTLVLNAEYRYPIWMNLDAVVFVDAGQVFNEFSEVAADQFRWSYGGGLHLLNRKGLSARFEVAGSTEGVRTILTVEPTFRRIAP